MLHTETVEAGTLALIKRFMADPQLSPFCLVGGTALALKIGHRKSIDIDLFTGTGYDAPALARYLSHMYNAQLRQVRTNSIYCVVEGVKVDLVTHAYPLVLAPEAIDGIRLWSLPDIAAMKLNAIRDNGTRLKDFVDMYFLLERHSLGDMLRFYGEKYGHENIPVARLSLLYHEDIKFEEPVDLTATSFNWQIIKGRIIYADRNKKQTFGKPFRQKMPNRAMKLPSTKFHKGRKR